MFVYKLMLKTFQKIILSTKQVVFFTDLYPYYFNILKENFVITKNILKQLLLMLTCLTYLLIFRILNQYISN